MKNIFRYLKSYSTQPFEVDRLIVSAYLEINQLQVLENQYLLEYSINENKIDEHTNLIDFILGIGLLTSNFYPIAFESLQEEREFVKLNHKYQEAFWKPYFHTIANKWKPFQEANIVWNPINEICPILI